MSRRLDEIAVTVSLSSPMYFIGTFDNGDGSYSDYRFSLPLLFLYLSFVSTKLIISTVDSASLTDPFFGTNITELTTGGQTYIAGVDFSQNTSTNTITGTTLSFSVGQKILVRI